MDSLDALELSVLAWLVLAVLACVASRPRLRALAVRTLWALFVSVVLYAVLTRNAALGVAASGIALMVWLMVKSRPRED